MAHRVSLSAETDLDDIWSYAAKESASIEAATRLIGTITDRFSVLSHFPFMGRSRNEDFGVGCRSVNVGEYVIVYCVENNDVLILRVVHGRRDLEGLFGP